MKWLILCREPQLYSCKRLKLACEMKGIEVDILDPNRMQLRLENGQFRYFYQFGQKYEAQPLTPLPHYDAVIPRFGTASTQMGCYVLQHFESQGVKVLNGTEPFRLARDKWQSLQRLVAQHIPVPNTAFSGELVATKAQMLDEQSAAVIKTLSGSQGVGVMLAERAQNALAILDTLQDAKIPAFVQHFVAESKGRDIRAFVIGDRVVAAMQRQGNSADFRANLHQGGSVQAVELSEENAKLAVNAAKALGLDVAGVDLIQSEKGLLVLEVNASPGFEGIERATGVDIAGQMVDYLVAKK